MLKTLFALKQVLGEDDGGGPIKRQGVELEKEE